jgi:hypothetical protein
VSARGAAWSAASLVVTLVVAALPARAEPRRLVLATRDPALRSALSAVFQPRGVEVVDAPATFQRPNDPVRDAAAAADVVWLCEPDGGGSALCVRPRRGQVIVRRIAMPTPLSAADAASLALSVEVALMPEEPAAAPPAPAVQEADVAATARPTGVAPPPPPRLTVEVLGGARRTASGDGVRVGVEAVYAPDGLARRLGVGLGVASGPSVVVPPGPSRGTGAAPPPVSERDLTLRLFARARPDLAWLLGPVHLELDTGPGLHVNGRDMPDSMSGARTTDWRLHLSVDGVLGAVVPFGRFFAGARAGASYRVTPLREGDGPSRWSGQALLTFGAGFL